MRWARGVLAVAGVRLEVVGTPPPLRATVIAANHISWLDIFVIQSVCPARFVAKSEVRDWPLLGWLCDRTGTLFIERERRHHTARINEVMRDVLAAGGTVGLFPEATTSPGDQLRKFHSSLFEASAATGASLVPAALVYRDAAGNRTDAAAYVDEMSLWDSLLAIAGEAGMVAELRFGEAISPAGLNRRRITARAYAAIAELLGLPAPPAAGQPLARSAHGT